MSNREPSTIKSLLRELSETLAGEREALGQRDSERLGALVERKTALVAALETAGGKFCRADSQPAELDELRELARACAYANRVNGGAIELNRNLVGRLLDTVRGVRRSAPLYDASGQLHGSKSLRPVARA